MFKEVKHGFQTFIKPYGLTTDEEMQEILHYRNSIYLNEEYITQEDVVQRHYRLDEYDQQSIHCIVRDPVESRLIGYTRMICDHEDALPIFKLFPAIKPLPGIQVEMSRLCIDSKYRGRLKPTSVNGILIMTNMQYSFEHGIKYWYCILDEQLYNILVKLYKFTVHTLGDAKYYMGGDCFPVAIDLESSVRNCPVLSVARTHNIILEHETRNPQLSSQK